MGPTEEATIPPEVDHVQDSGLREAANVDDSAPVSTFPASTQDGKQGEYVASPQALLKVNAPKVDPVELEVSSNREDAEEEEEEEFDLGARFIPENSFNVARMSHKEPKEGETQNAGAPKSTLSTRADSKPAKAESIVRNSSRKTDGQLIKSSSAGSMNGQRSGSTTQSPTLGRLPFGPGDEVSSGKGCFGRLEVLVLSTWFEAIFVVLILANTIVMCFEVQYAGMDHEHKLLKQLAEEGVNISYSVNTASDRSAEDDWPGAEEAFQVLEWFFGIAFTIEVGLKLIVLRRKFFKESWNLLDSVIVAFWMVTRLQTSGIPINPSIFRLARLVRLLRLLRLAKSMQGFDALYLMTTSIRGSVSALAWSIVVLAIIQTMIALILQTMVEGYIKESNNDQTKRHEVFQYYGTFTRSLLSMFELTLANWPDAARVLTENISEWYTPVLLTFHFLVGFGVVRVMMAVFVLVTFDVAQNDDQIMVNRRERSYKTHIKKMTALFKAADSDGNGHLDANEFSTIFDDPSVRKWLGAMEFDMSLFGAGSAALFSLLDDGDGRLTAEELVNGVNRLKGPAKSFTMASVMKESQEALTSVQDIGRKLRATTHRMTCPTTVTSYKNVWSASPSSIKDRGERADRGSDDGKKSSAATFSDQGSMGRRTRTSTIAEVLFDGAPTNPSRRSLVTENMTQRFPRFFGGWDKLHDFVMSTRFEGFFVLMIVANSILLAVMSQYDGMDLGHEVGYPGMENHTAEQSWPGAKTALLVFDWVFGILFVVELSLKMLAQAHTFFFFAWNWLDFVVVVMWVVDKAYSGLPVDPMLLRMARLIRLLRMLRLVKRIQEFSSLYLMTTAIKASLSALFWSIALLFTGLVLIALLLNATLGDYFDDDGIPEAERHEVYRYYGTFSRTMLTMFEFALANWITPARALTENVNELYMIFAIAHKVLIGFAMLTVLTGVFIQETFNVAESDDTIMVNHRNRMIRTHFKKMNMLFDAADVDCSGSIDKEEFFKVLENPGINLWLSAMGLDVEHNEMLFELLTKNNPDDKLTRQELMEGMAQMKGTARHIDLAILQKEVRKLKESLENILRQVRGITHSMEIADSQELAAATRHGQAAEAPSEAVVPDVELDEMKEETQEEA
mmetsp:Transcript_25761/g.60159  ORF Transcript_25761/g.60159 Transcript_25761/m.60159 type:complete len:1130 (-) Transcript_25761:48-3437(-)